MCKFFVNFLWNFHDFSWFFQEFLCKFSTKNDLKWLKMNENSWFLGIFRSFSVKFHSFFIKNSWVNPLKILKFSSISWLFGSKNSRKISWNFNSTTAQISVELSCRINRKSLSNYLFGFPNFSTPMRYKSFWKFYIFAQIIFQIKLKSVVKLGFWATVELSLGCCRIIFLIILGCCRINLSN